MRSTLLCLLALAPACTDIGSEQGAPAECIPASSQGQSLTIAGVAPEIDMQPGATRQLDVSVAMTNGELPQPVGNGCDITWSVSGSGATVTDDGLLTMDANAALGTKRTVSAKVKTQHYAGNSEDPESGGETVGTPFVDVWTYTPEAMPQVGTWRETMRSGCEDATERAPADNDKINELVVFASGLTWVTWSPFETYIDYWAHGVFTSSAVELDNPAGNYVPTDADLDGSFKVENNDLLLMDMYLGSHAQTAPPNTLVCGHRFTKP